MRVWDLPLWCHALGLAALLGVLAVATAPIARLFVDEGLAIIQAQNLADGNGWGLPWAFGGVDPAGTGLIIPNHSADLVVYGKHPLYLYALAVLQKVGGVPAMLVMSIVGTVGAAAAGAWLARLVRRGLERWVFWLVGVGSPLLFDGLIVVAHTVTAALVTVAVCVSVLLQRRASHWWWLVFAPAVAVSVMFRAEAVLFLGAWAAVLVAWGLLRRDWNTSAVGGGIAGIVGVSRLVESWWASVVTGPDATDLASSGGHAVTSGLNRVDAFFLTTVGSAPPGVTQTATALLPAATLLLFAAAIMFRRRRWALAGICGGLYLAVVVAALVLRPSATVPGILLVFPALVCAIGFLRRRWFRDDLRLALSTTVGLFACAVFATQYGQGGGVEWGARYLALAIPVVAVLAVDVLHGQWRRVDRRHAQIGLAVVVTASLAVATLSMLVLGRIHETTASTLEPLMTTAARVEPGDGGKPVVVTDSWALGRLAWPDHDRFRWVYRPADHRDVWDDRLSRAGVEAYTELWEYGTPRAEVRSVLPEPHDDSDRTGVRGGGGTR